MTGDESRTPGRKRKDDARLTAVCPGCEKRIRVPVRYAGHTVACPACKGRAPVPSVESKEKTSIGSTQHTPRAAQVAVVPRTVESPPPSPGSREAARHAAAAALMSAKFKWGSIGTVAIVYLYVSLMSSASMLPGSDAYAEFKLVLLVAAFVWASYYHAHLVVPLIVPRRPPVEHAPNDDAVRAACPNCGGRFVGGVCATCQAPHPLVQKWLSGLGKWSVPFVVIPLLLFLGSARPWDWWLDTTTPGLRESVVGPTSDAVRASYRTAGLIIRVVAGLIAVAWIVAYYGEPIRDCLYAWCVAPVMRAARWTGGVAVWPFARVGALLAGPLKAVDGCSGRCVDWIGGWLAWPFTVFQRNADVVAETWEVPGFVVPDGRFTADLAGCGGADRYARAVEEIRGLAERGDCSGLAELELLIRANAPGDRPPVFYIPVVVAQIGMPDLESLCRDFERFAKSPGGVLANAEQVQSRIAKLITPFVLQLGYVGRAKEHVRAEVGAREAHAFELLFAQIVVGAAYVRATR